MGQAHIYIYLHILTHIHFYLHIFTLIYTRLALFRSLYIYLYLLKSIGNFSSFRPSFRPLSTFEAPSPLRHPLSFFFPVKNSSPYTYTFNLYVFRSLHRFHFSSFSSPFFPHLFSFSILIRILIRSSYPMLIRFSFSLSLPFLPLYLSFLLPSLLYILIIHIHIYTYIRISIRISIRIYILISFLIYSDVIFPFNSSNFFGKFQSSKISGKYFLENFPKIKKFWKILFRIFQKIFELGASPIKINLIKRFPKH